jgi:UDP-N-acetylglucosamine 2-epimerase (non-hydrolysing)
MRILFVFGTRPEAIKMAPLYQELSLSDRFQVDVCVTAQHRGMLDQVLSFFGIIPKYDLNLMAPGQGLNALLSRIVGGFDVVLLDAKPDWVIVHGDTTTALATALACFHSRVPVAHVEAGLRTRNMTSPFPEEFNRYIVSRIARLHFAPTVTSRGNLLEEGVDPQSIFVTGNTVIDALHAVESRIRREKDLVESIQSWLKEWIALDVLTRSFVLITGHRRENFGIGFLNICNAIRELSILHPGVAFLYPVHLNPNVQTPVSGLLSGLHNVYLLPPCSYEVFVYLLVHCKLVLTDSGGVQEEAPSLGKPVLVMRDTTERPEAVQAGTVRLVGSSVEGIVSATSELLADHKLYSMMSLAHNPYGDGTACKQIREALEKLQDES